MTSLVYILTIKLAREPFRCQVDILGHAKKAKNHKDSSPFKCVYFYRFLIIFVNIIKNLIKIKVLNEREVFPMT